jgi:hypothetical protein
MFKLSKELSNYRPKEAVNLFKELLNLEAIKNDIPLTYINCSENITVADGGIDAAIKSMNDIRSDIIIADDIRFQIKTDNNLPWNKSTIANELFGCNIKEIDKLTTVSKMKNKLKSAIRDCLDDGAAYVYVTFKHTFVEKDRITTINLLKKYFNQYGYFNCNVNVWGYEQLNNVIEKNYPALLLNIKTNTTSSAYTLYKTISQQSDLRNKYFEDEHRTNIISSVRKLLKVQNKDDRAMHIRVLGASGIGKTKTVVQILSDSDLKCNCIFFKSPEEYNNSLLKNYINENKNVSLIFVIDECDSRNTGKIFNGIEYNVSNVKLITIYNSNHVDTRVDKDKVFIVKELSEHTLLELIKRDCPTLPNDTCKKIVRLCEGFARAAMIVAGNISKNPEQYLENLDDIWLKYVSDEKSIDSEETKEKMKILEYFSLFERIGFKGTFSSEFEFVCSRIKDTYGIQEGNINGYIDKLKNKLILRGENALYISPRIFQNWLKKNWWKKNTHTFKYEKFVENMPKTLLEFFNKEVSECPTDVIDTILQNQFNNYNDIIAKKKLFQSIACQRNNNVFEKLKKEIENLNEETLSNVDEDMQALLAYYAKSPDYFTKSCDLLFKIAVLENRNTAQSFFADLFTIFYSSVDMASTYTPLPDKIDYLNSLIKLKKMKREILIILKAIEQGMQDPLNINKQECNSTKITVTFLRQFNFKDVESRYIDDLFKLTLTILGQSSDIEIIKKCNYIFNTIAFYLLQNNETFKVVLNQYKELINTKKYDIFELIRSFNNAFRHNRIKELNEENISKLRIFYEYLKKTNKFTDLKVLCIQHRIQDEEKEIFNNLVNNTDLEENEMLEFLFSDKSKLSFYVGIKKAAGDNDLSIYKKIIDKYVELKTPKNIDLIVGYFCGLYEKNQDTFDDITLRIDCKSPLYTILPDIINTRPTDKTVKYLFNLIKSNKFSITDLKSRISQCSKQLLTEIIEYIIAKEKSAVYLCLDFISYNKGRIKFDENLVLKYLDVSLKQVFKNNNGDYIIYLWNKILNEYVNSKSPLNYLLEMFEKIIITSDAFSDKSTKNSLLFLAKLHPQEMWEKLSNILDNNKQNISHLFKIKNYWLNNGFLSIFDESLILKWISEKENNRLNIILDLAPDHFLPTEKEFDMAFYRKLLIKYPDNKRLKQNLHTQSGNGVFGGKMSDNLGEKITNLKELIKDEKEKIIKDWLKEELNDCNKILKSIKEQEERVIF